MMADAAAVAAGLKPLNSFEQLVVGAHNQVAVGACMEVVKAPGETYNPLFVYGPPGVGKTHIMQAVAHQILQRNPAFKVRYISAERFMSEVLTAISEDRMLEVRRQYSLLDLLIIDDVQYMTESKISQEELFHVFNNLHQANRQVILAADRPPNQLTTLNKNIRTRLEWGLSTDIKIPDEPTRIEILRRKQKNSQGLEMTDPMFLYVAKNLKSSVRELEGFLKRIHAYVTLSHQDLTMDLVKSVVKEIMPEGSSETEVDMGSAAPAPVPKTAPKNGHAAPAAPPAPPPPLPHPALSFDLLVEAIDPVPAPPASPRPPAAPPLPAAPTLKQPAPEFVIPPQPPAAPATVREAGPPSLNGETSEDESQEFVPGQKEISAVFFYPEGCNDALTTVAKKFQEVIKKHKLKFRLKGVHNEPYAYKGKINYSSFVDVCKNNKVPVAVVIGPPPDNVLPQQDFYDLLTVTLDVQGVSLQLVNWSETNKDYRYLNLALDIALVRAR